MIRLNDINKTVIDESKVVAYSGYEQGNAYGERKDYYINFILNSKLYVEYNSKEARDKDIELLDKLFDTKSIKDKANAYPHEIDALKFAMSGIKQECEPAKEEYITWDYVCQLGSIIATLPSGERVKCIYNQADIIGFYSIVTNRYDGYIANKDLFNALKLKKVE